MLSKLTTLYCVSKWYRLLKLSVDMCQSVCHLDTSITDTIVDSQRDNQNWYKFINQLKE